MGARVVEREAVVGPYHFHREGDRQDDVLWLIEARADSHATMSAVYEMLPKGTTLSPKEAWRQLKDFREAARRAAVGFDPSWAP